MICSHDRVGREVKTGEDSEDSEGVLHPTVT